MKQPEMKTTWREQKILDEIGELSAKLLKKHYVKGLKLTERGQFLKQEAEVQVIKGSLTGASLLELIEIV